MGTNYYFYANPKCDVCGRENEPVHIGKASAGWCFGLHVMPEEKINTWQDWLDMFTKYKGSYIKDEYGDIISVLELVDIVNDRKQVAKCVWTEQDYKDNHAEPGPYGLIRHKVDGRFCIGHSIGTYDYITGKFR